MAPAGAPPPSTPPPATPPPGTYPPPMQGGPPHQQQGYPPHGYPPQGYPPQGYGHYPQHGRPPGRGKGKLIAILVVAAALAAGGIVLAVVLSNKSSGDGGGGGGGFETAEALARATTEALAAGDGDKLLSFTPPMEAMLTALDCPAEAKATNEQQAKQGYEESKKRFAEAAGKMKGSEATFKSAHTDGIARQEMKVGDAVGPCKAKIAVTMTGVGVEVDYTNPADKSKQSHQTTYGVMILDGRYYLLDTGQIPEPLRGDATTPTTPTTPGADNAAAGDPEALKPELEAIRSAACACTDKACADTQWTRLMGFVDKNKATLESPLAASVNAIGSEAIRCLDKLRMQPTTPTPPATPTPTPPATPTPSGQGLPECEAYAKAAERFIKCNKVPKQSRDAVQTAVDQMRKNWGDPATLSEDMRKSAAETCATLEKSMKDAAKAIGCK